MGHFPRLSTWALNVITNGFIKERQRKMRHIQKRRRQCDHGGIDWNDTATSQEASGANRNWERHRKDCL